MKDYEYAAQQSPVSEDELDEAYELKYGLTRRAEQGPRDPAAETHRSKTTLPNEGNEHGTHLARRR